MMFKLNLRKYDDLSREPMLVDDNHFASIKM